jgi:hypothetical protein
VSLPCRKQDGFGTKADNEVFAGQKFLRIDSSFLFFINEILCEITAENKRRMKLLNELYYGRFFAELSLELLLTDMEM